VGVGGHTNKPSVEGVWIFSGTTHGRLPDTHFVWFLKHYFLVSIYTEVVQIGETCLAQEHKFPKIISCQGLGTLAIWPMHLNFLL